MYSYALFSKYGFRKGHELRMFPEFVSYTNNQPCSTTHSNKIKKTYLSNVAASMYFPLGENFTNDTGGLSSSASKNLFIYQISQKPGLRGRFGTFLLPFIVNTKHVKLKFLRMKLQPQTELKVSCNNHYTLYIIIIN